MSSALHIHVGGAGVMAGNSLWKLYMKEQPDSEKKGYIFKEEQNAECPRVIFADLDDRMINQVKSERIVNFKLDSFVNGKEDAANNYCKGHYTIGKELVDDCLNKIRKQSEACDKLDQFVLTSSISGGTGSGFFSLLTERLSVDYPKISKHAFQIYPSRNMSNNVVDAYNAVLTTHSTLEHCDTVIMFDNESMYSLLQDQVDLEFVDYSHLNNLISQVISSYTGIQRFNYKSNNIVLNTLIPYPRLHFVIPSYGPLIQINDDKKVYFSQREQLKYIFSNPAQNYKLELTPRYLSSALISRGLNQDQFFGQKDFTYQLHSYNQRPGLFQCNSKNYQIISELVSLKQTQTLLANDAAIYYELNKLGHKYDTLYSKRAFVHWFVGEGCESGELSECREDLAALINDYEEIYQGENYCEEEEMILGGRVPLE